MSNKTCANCGESKRGENELNELHVETRNDGRQHVNLCDLCYPDFWDDLGPGEFIALEHTGMEVCQPYWRCDDCDTVYPYDLVKIVMDTDYDPEIEAAICGFCQRKYKDRYKTKEKESKQMEQLTGAIVYRTSQGIIITGYPSEEDETATEAAHNCDAMGCGQEHVLYRFPLPSLATQQEELHEGDHVRFTATGKVVAVLSGGHCMVTFHGEDVPFMCSQLVKE